MERTRDSKGKYLPIHNGTDTRLYETWCSMKERCYNLHNRSYKNYGKKGIKVCEEWKHDFASFKAWALSNGYTDNLTIDRIDFDGNYEPNNCRWITRKEQNRNYSRNHFINYCGKRYCVKELAEMFNINPATILYRINHDYSIENIIKKGDNRYGHKQN